MNKLCCEIFFIEISRSFLYFPFAYLHSAGDHNGSISAEHGLGFKKSKEIYYSRKPAAVNVMRNLKKLFDPKVYIKCYFP